MASEVSREGHAEAARIISAILEETSKRVIGQEPLRRRLIIALVCDGHILLEGVPGLGKTLAIKVLADVIDASFKRIQFTPDLLPADLIGTEIYRPQEGRFEVRKGPVFANFVLADEINRAPAKVQSALLETMQEHQVTIGQETFHVPEPFFVMATQNPIEQEGTYPLPEAQVDRFMMKVRVDYPTPEEELQVLDLVDRAPGAANSRRVVANMENIAFLRTQARSIYVDERVRRYVVSLVDTSRHPERARVGAKDLARMIELGASPRASMSLFAGARAEALLNGQDFVSPQNVKDIALDVLRHRIALTFEAEAQGVQSDEVVRMLLESVEVP